MKDNNKRDIWFEADIVLEATDRFKVNSSLVMNALRKINFWDEVDQEETIEAILQKIEPFILEMKREI